MRSYIWNILIKISCKNKLGIRKILLSGNMSNAILDSSSLFLFLLAFKDGAMRVLSC